MILSEPFYGCADVNLMSACTQGCPALGNCITPGFELFALQMPTARGQRCGWLGNGSDWPIWTPVEHSTESAHKQPRVHRDMQGRLPGWRTCLETPDLL